LGHQISECRKLQYRNKANVTESETSDTLFLSCQVSQQILDKDVWLLDSGCSNHMTGQNDLFSNLDTSLITTISLGDDHPIQASGKGCKVAREVVGGPRGPIVIIVEVIQCKVD